MCLNTLLAERSEVYTYDAWGSRPVAEQSPKSAPPHPDIRYMPRPDVVRFVCAPEHHACVRDMHAPAHCMYDLELARLADPDEGGPHGLLRPFI